MSISRDIDTSYHAKAANWLSSNPQEAANMGIEPERFIVGAAVGEVVESAAAAATALKFTDANMPPSLKARLPECRQQYLGLTGGSSHLPPDINNLLAQANQIARDSWDDGAIKSALQLSARAKESVLADKGLSEMLSYYNNNYAAVSRSIAATTSS